MQHRLYQIDGTGDLFSLAMLKKKALMGKIDPDSVVSEIQYDARGVACDVNEFAGREINGDFLKERETRERASIEKSPLDDALEELPLDDALE